MSRKGDFSLMYEIVGLLIFGIVSLVWFGGIESIFGSLTTDKAVDAFNQLTGAIKSQCLGGRPVTLTGLDLNTYGSTYIITQLRIPPNMDANTMGMIQPAMRKCVGADCLCLLKLNELDGNWQMCTTSDWDSWNLGIGGILGAPGCPFWYYAPPEIIEQSIQDLMDYLSLDEYQFLFSAVPWLRGNDPIEHYSYPAPELWGGCSYANEDNITISGFSDFHTSFDCASLSGKVLDSYFESSPKQELVDYASVDFNADPLLLTSSLSDIGNAAKGIIINYFVRAVDEKEGNNYDSVIKTYSSGGINSPDFEDGMKSTMEDVMTWMGIDNADKIAECKGVVYDAIKDSFDDVYENQDIISGQEKSGVQVYGDYKVNSSLDFSVLPSNINGFDISFVAKNDTVLTPVLYVKIGNCEQLVNVVTVGYKRYNLHFSPSCLDNIIYFSEGYGAEDRKISIKTADEGPVTQFYDGAQWEDSDSLLLNVTFNRKYGNSLKNYVEGTIASNLMSQAFDGATVDSNTLTSVDDYTDLINNAVSGMSFDDYDNILHQHYSDNYASYFDRILQKPVFDTDEQGCRQVFDPVSDIKKSYESIEEQTRNDLKGYFSGKVNALPELKVVFSSVNPDQDYSFDNIGLSVEDFSSEMGQQQLPYIKEALSNCLGITVEKDYDNVIIGNYSKLLSDYLTCSSPFLVNDLKVDSLDVDVPAEFSFKDNFKDFLLSTFDNATVKLFNDNDAGIRSKVLQAAQYVSAALSKVVQAKWSGRPLYPVDCWPKVGGGYFKGYPAVNDLLAWRKYTSVSRLTPFLAMFTLDAANNLIVQPISNKIEGALFKKIDDSIGIFGSGHSYTVYNVGGAAFSVDRGEAYKFLSESNVVNGIPCITVGGKEVPLADYVERMGRSFLRKLVFKYTGGSFFSGVFKGLIKKVAKEASEEVAEQIAKEVVKDVFKQFLKRAALKLLAKLPGIAMQVGINLWKNSIFTSVNEDEVVYANGGIRTFNPRLVEVKSCVRMDELGCPSTYSVWVNESYYCNTDLYVRRIVNPATWFNYIEGKDKCQFATHGEESCISSWNSSEASCYKDTLTTCYKLSCSLTGSTDPSNGDRYHIFQYWVGANSDPAGILGTQSGKIQALKVYNASLGKRSVIMLEVMGGNESSKLPASIV